MKRATAKTPGWLEVFRNGLVVVKIYRIENKGRKISPSPVHAAGKHAQNIFASLDVAVAEVKANTTTLKGDAAAFPPQPARWIYRAIHYARDQAAGQWSGTVSVGVCAA